MKKAILIGATSGIGRGLAKQLAANGYLVGFTGRREHLLQELKTEQPDCFVVKPFDVTDVQSISAHLQELTDELGGVDLIVINSGTGHRNETLDFQLEEKAILTNVHGFTAVADWAFNYFRKQQKGHLAAVSSIAGIRGNRFAPAYCASKAYQISYLQALRQKAKRLKLDLVVTDIRPGFVDTALAQGDHLFWVASVDKAAHQIMQALQKKKEITYITKRWSIIGFILPLIPRWIYERF